jgi:hypothetical protein
MTGEDDASAGTNAPVTFVPVAGEVYERQLGRWSRRIAPHPSNNGSPQFLHQSSRRNPARCRRASRPTNAARSARR